MNAENRKYFSIFESVNFSTEKFFAITGHVLFHFKRFRDRHLFEQVRINFLCTVELLRILDPFFCRSRTSKTSIFS